MSGSNLGRLTALCAAALLVTAGAVWAGAEPSRDTTTLKVAYFPAAGRYAGIYDAIQKGLYARLHVNVRLVPIYGGEDRIAALRASRVDLILTDTTEAVLARESGIDLRVVGIIEAENSLATVSVRSSHISTPRDYAGRTFGAKAGGLELKLLPVLASLDGFRASAVRVKQVDYSALFPALMGGKVDFIISFYDSGQHAWERAAAQQGKPLQTVRWSQFGLTTYGDSVVAGGQTLRTKPEAVRAFLRATMEGFVDAAAHPAEVPAIVKHFAPTERNDDIAVDWSRGLALLTDAGTRVHGLGWVDPAKFARTVRVALKAYRMSAAVSSRAIFDDTYLPGPSVNIRR